MTNEQAKSELMQIYMSLSEEKKKALDVAFKALEQSMPTMVYPQVDGITPTVVAQADGEKTCGTCRNEDTYHCAECENKSDYEQAQADGEKNCFNCKWYPDNDITKGFDEVCHKCSNSDKWEGLIKRAPWEDIAPPPKIPEAQADGEYISRQAVLDYIYNDLGLGDEENGKDVERQMDLVVSYKYVKSLPPVKLPSVAIPSAEPKTGHWIFDEILDRNYYCSECKSMGVDYWDYCPYCGCKMVEPQERSDKE